MTGWAKADATKPKMNSTAADIFIVTARSIRCQMPGRIPSAGKQSSGDVDANFKISRDFKRYGPGANPSSVPDST